MSICLSVGGLIIDYNGFVIHNNNKDIANNSSFDWQDNKKMYNPKNEQFDEQFGTGASMVLTALYFNVKNQPDFFQVSKLTGQQLSKLSGASPRTVENILARMEAQDLITKIHNGNYRSIYLNPHKLLGGIIDICENNAEVLKQRAYKFIKQAKDVFKND